MSFPHNVRMITNYILLRNVRQAAKNVSEFILCSHTCSGRFRSCSMLNRSRNKSPISILGIRRFLAGSSDGKRQPWYPESAINSTKNPRQWQNILQRYYFSDDPRRDTSHQKASLCCQVINQESTSKIRQTSKKLKDTKEKMKEKVEEIIYKENVLTVPNLLCVTRIALSPVLGYLVLQQSYNYALGIFVFAGVTDLLDGLIARQFPSQQSMLGSFLDPMADKFLISLLFLSLTGVELIPVPLTALIISRDLCLVGAGFYIRYLSLPAPKTLSRYFDLTHATAKLSPTFVSKVNTSVQLALVACTLAAPVFHLVGHPALQALWYITAATTVSSGLSYVFRKDTFKLLYKNSKKSLTGRDSETSERKHT